MTANQIQPISLRELRERFPFKPHDRATLDGREVEVISYPYPDDPRPVGILVRTTPGDPSTMIPVEAGYLEPGSTPAGACEVRQEGSNPAGA